MNNIDKKYQSLLQDILDNGVEKKDRTGTGTLSVFGRQIRHNMSEGFPLLTTKKMHWNSIVTELLWFLSGNTNIKYLVDNDCHIWDGDVWKNYIDEFRRTCPKCPEITKEQFLNKIKTDDEFAKKWGDLGPIYGKQWRAWTGYESNTKVNGVYDEYSIDQIANSINLLKTDPDSRRNRVNAWNVGELDEMVLPPCHTDFQFYTRELNIQERLDWAKVKHPNIVNENGWSNLYSNFEEAQIWFDRYDIGKITPTRAISLMWNQRSVDTFLGLPFNIASYALLLTMIADEVNMVTDELIGNLGDTHLYLNHIEQAKEQITREAFKLPTVSVNDGIYCSSIYDVILKNYQSHPAIKAPLSN